MLGAQGCTRQTPTGQPHGPGLLPVPEHGTAPAAESLARRSLRSVVYVYVRRSARSALYAPSAPLLCHVVRVNLRLLCTCGCALNVFGCAGFVSSCVELWTRGKSRVVMVTR